MNYILSIDNYVDGGYCDFDVVTVTPLAFRLKNIYFN